ncbi:Eco57I restriction-modification methylase domain-containing protein [Duganella radicis]|uniref:site-specific DNA-methyltransferase (adenine-specific) n=1 Tax=Duganella radicis TaxID=551988 RepID=A0A6L6PHY4_9BURK|nr:N-6 DNA methylase [Duganella radicis]MTV38650.1 N-6 DNA methylase [Duganella radicis]
MNFIENESEQKLRGGYYTPEDLATYILKWVNAAAPGSILEPSCGDGIFAQALASVDPGRKVELTAFELLDEEYQKTVRRCADLGVKAQVAHGDFLDWAIRKMIAGVPLFDGVVGNPPFIRYQYLPPEAQEKAELIFKMLRLKFTKHTNAWVPFVLASLALLKPGGRLGMILPSEIIHVMHAQSLRTYLGEQCSRLLIIDPEEIWFEGTLQGAVILFAEKKLEREQHSDGVGIHKVVGKEFMQADPGQLFDSVARINGETVEGKWTHALLTKEERTLFKQLCDNEQVHTFEQIADVDVGIVTGANKFFLVADQTVAEYELGKYAFPMFGRSEHCPGIIYNEAQHRANASKGSPTNFIWIRDAVDTLPKRVREYIKTGEAQRLHTRYKCRIRSPWYTVPSVRASKIGMLKRSHDTPKLIFNELGAYTTDTAYRISIKDGIDERKLVYCFGNALTALSAELEGRHYGGGVLELVPSEIEALQIVLPKALNAFDLSELDGLIREESAQRVLEKQTRIILGALGVTAQQQKMLLDAWLRLKNRRQRISEAEED